MKYIKLFLLMVSLSFIEYHQAVAQKIDGQWLLNLSAQYKNKGGGFSIGGEKYIPNTYSSFRAEFSYSKNKNRFSIKDFSCHVNTFALRLTYFYSLEKIVIRNSRSRDIVCRIKKQNITIAKKS